MVSHPFIIFCHPISFWALIASSRSCLYLVSSSSHISMWLPVLIQWSIPFPSIIFISRRRKRTPRRFHCETKTGGTSPETCFLVCPNGQTHGTNGLTSQAQKTPFYASSKIAILVNGLAVTTKAEKVVQKELTTQPLQDYILQRETWTHKIFHFVHWDAVGRALKSLDIQKQINTIKYIFDWQNTGEQKQRFEASQVTKDERDERDVSKCPLNCGCVETAQHFLRCKVLRNAHITYRCCDSLHRWFGQQKTHKML